LTTQIDVAYQKIIADTSIAHNDCNEFTIKLHMIHAALDALQQSITQTEGQTTTVLPQQFWQQQQTQNRHKFFVSQLPHDPAERLTAEHTFFERLAEATTNTATTLTTTLTTHHGRR